MTSPYRESAPVNHEAETAKAEAYYYRQAVIEARDLLCNLQNYKASIIVMEAARAVAALEEVIASGPRKFEEELSRRRDLPRELVHMTREAAQRDREYVELKKLQVSLKERLVAEQFRCKALEVENETLRALLKKKKPPSAWRRFWRWFWRH